MLDLSSSEAKTRFLVGKYVDWLCHDIPRNLSYMHYRIENILKMENLDPKLIRELRALKSTIDSSYKLIRRFSEYFKTSDEQISKPIIDSIIKQLSYEYYYKVLQVDNVILKVDHAAFYSILDNLVSNCSSSFYKKFGTDQTKDRIIEISLIKENDKAKLIVEDNGVGLPDDFKLGLRKGQWSKIARGGLTIVSDLLNDYGGKLSWEKSEKLGGAKFIAEFKTYEQ